MNRTDARDRVMQILYRIDVLEETDRKVIDEWIADYALGDQQPYAENIVSCFLEKRGEIDRSINDQSEKWNTTRMARTDLAILRLAICEIKYWDDIPDAVSADAAVKLAKTYGTDDAPAFINGILGNIIRSKK